MQRPLARISRNLMLAPLLAVGVMWARSHFVCDTLTLEERGETTITFDGRVWTCDIVPVSQRSVGSSHGRLRIVAKFLAIQKSNNWIPMRPKLGYSTLALTRTANGELPRANDDGLGGVTMAGSDFLPVIRYRYSWVEVSYWQLAAVAATPQLARLGSMALKRFRRLRRKRHGLCPQCGYNLVASLGRCPECGAGA